MLQRIIPVAITLLVIGYCKAFILEDDIHVE